MSTILDLSDIAQRMGQPATAWRDQMLPATFRNQQFHVESQSIQGGDHVVEHEFPKRNIPYAESMGRRPYEFSVRGYCIVFPYNSNQPLYQRDYRVPRDNLRNVLDDQQPGILQLPTTLPLYVRCTRYTLTEEQRLGGYCVFDMSFVEYGIKPTAASGANMQTVVSASQTLKARVQAVLAQAPNQIPFGSTPGTAAPGPAPLRLTHGSTGRAGSEPNRAARAARLGSNIPAAGPPRI